METGTINVSGYHRIYQLYEGSKSTVYRAIRDFDNAPVIVKLRPQPEHVDVLEHFLWNEEAVLYDTIRIYTSAQRTDPI